MATTLDQPFLVQRLVSTRMPTRHGEFTMYGYALPPLNGVAPRVEHIALVQAGSRFTHEPPLVRVHSECLTGDALGSCRCDCGDQLDAALRIIADSGAGALVYALGHEGRGIGLLGKLQAYALQDRGADTVDANLALGFPADARDYSLSAAILRDLGMGTIRLLSSNPAKQEALEEFGITVAARVGMHVRPREQNVRYLTTKRLRMRHDRPSDDTWRLLRRGQVRQAYDAEGADLIEQYGPFAAGPVVLAQLGQSLDGFIAPPGGKGTIITGEEDREHLHRLRALVDAVVVGASTVVADDCLLTVRSVTGENPTRVLIDPNGRIPRTSRVLTDGAAPTLWLTAEDVGAAPADHVEIRRLPSEDFTCEKILLALAHGGLDRVLIEGGGRTVSRFVTAGKVDRLFITTAPFLLGEGVPGIRLAGLGEAGMRAPVRQFRRGEDTCVEFHLSAGQ